MQQGQREHPRAPFHEVVRCITPTGEQILASGGNISCGGLFVPTSQNLRPGTHISVKFRLPYPSHSFEQTAEVVWRRGPDETPAGPHGVGLRFVGLPHEARSAIASFVDRQAPAS